MPDMPARTRKRCFTDCCCKSNKPVRCSPVRASRSTRDYTESSAERRATKNKQNELVRTSRTAQSSAVRRKQRAPRACTGSHEPGAIPKRYSDQKAAQCQVLDAFGDPSVVADNGPTTSRSRPMSACAARVIFRWLFASQVLYTRAVN